MSTDTAARVITRTSHTTVHPWPADCFLQGGTAGLVFTKTGSYRTAFVEAFPADPQTFIRGEGPTLAEAEDAAWGKLQRHLACPGHDFECRGYTNGAGFCRHCSMFSSKVFDPATLCEVCAVPTDWSTAGGFWYCEEHAMTRQERRAADAAAGVELGVIEGMLDALASEGDD